MWHYVLSKIWKNMHRDIEIDRNWRPEELLKLGGGQNILTFRGEGCPMKGRSENFHFPMRGGV